MSAAELASRAPGGRPAIPGAERAAIEPAHLLPGAQPSDGAVTRPGTRPGSGPATLIRLEYLSPLAGTIELQRDLTHRVVTADFVTLENTGMVHVAPGRGWDDFLLGCKESLPIICPVDASGRFTGEVESVSGLFVKDADAILLGDLGDHLMAKEVIVHRFGHCWRCKTPIIFRAT